MEFKLFFECCLLYTICIVNFGESQNLYSLTVQWMPTGHLDQFQFYSHMSWKQENATSGTCLTPTCLGVYKITNKNVQTFGRIDNMEWMCTAGCPSNDTVTDLGQVYFTEVSSFSGVNWEAGDETTLYDFISVTENELKIGFIYRNGSTSKLTSLFSAIVINLAVRNDTKRPNLSPSVVAFPIYFVPLGCGIEIDLHPYDGDGDTVRCSWTLPLFGASLDQSTCKITITATGGNGYIKNTDYSVAIDVKDYTTSAVNLTRKGATTVTRGPLSITPVLLTIRVTVPLTDIRQCSEKLNFEEENNNTFSVVPPFSYSNSFRLQGQVSGVKLLNVSHQGGTFYLTPVGEYVNLTSSNSSDIGIYRVCAMAYSTDGVPGDSFCDNILVGDTDDCLSDKCTDGVDGTCTDFYSYYTCEYSPEGHSINVGLVVGAVLGAVCVLAGVAALTVFMYTRHNRKRRQEKVAPDT